MIIFNHMFKFTTMNSLLEIQTTPSSATNTVNTGIIEALMEQEEDNEARLARPEDLQTRITDKKLILSSELKLEPQSDRDQEEISRPTPDRPGDNPDDSGQHSFQVCKISCRLETGECQTVLISNIEMAGVVRGGRGRNDIH